MPDPDKTDPKDYLQIVRHYESCFAKHGDSHLGVDWPRLEDTETRHRIMMELFRGDSSSEISILDLGCGLSHFMDFLNRQGVRNVSYSGLDLSGKFVEASRSKYPKNTYYCLDVLESSELLPNFDYIVMNGIFTQKKDLSHANMISFLQRMVAVTFQKAGKGIAFNVMSKEVDWENEGAFHLAFDLLARFLVKSISRKFTFRHDYGLYEYTTYIYK